jgi:uncharacterized membrane protein
MRTFKYLDLFIISIIALACVVSVLAGVTAPPVRVIVACLLVLILPGYAFFVAVFPERILDSAESFLVMIGSSIMLTAVSGIIINLLGQKLQAPLWALVSGGLVLAGCVISGSRRLARVPAISPAPILPFKCQHVLIISVAVLMAVGAMGLASSPITNPVHLQGYAILWILPVQNNTPGTIRLGVVSGQFTSADYNLQVTIGNKIVKQWPDIQLGPGMSWEATVQEPGNLPASTPVEAFLYKSDQPNTVYRHVKLLP